MRNASMEEGIVLWAKACLNLVGLIGRQGRSRMYLRVNHPSLVMKS